MAIQRQQTQTYSISMYMNIWNVICSRPLKNQVTAQIGRGPDSLGEVDLCRGRIFKLCSFVGSSSNIVFPKISKDCINWVTKHDDDEGNGDDGGERDEERVYFIAKKGTSRLWVQKSVRIACWSVSQHFTDKKGKCHSKKNAILLFLKITKIMCICVSLH